jgi:hypothetical protein
MALISMSLRLRRQKAGPSPPDHRRRHPAHRPRRTGLHSVALEETPASWAMAARMTKALKLALFFEAKLDLTVMA